MLRYFAQCFLDPLRKDYYNYTWDHKTYTISGSNRACHGAVIAEARKIVTFVKSVSPPPENEIIYQIKVP